MHVVVTAGHVDHGKSTLVRALTGFDPDRLAEERRRGLSIQLGYCWTELPPVGDVAFVDVPGHERFLATTLSGMGPVPVAMFVVAADDPWMPQAAEHLAALDALDVRHGLLVVTRADLADPGPTLLRAREELSGTSLSGAAEVVVSGHTGEGMDDLRRTLGALVSSVPEPDPDADVRLWLDRRFSIRGTGTVVTGTLQAGTLRVGDQLASGDVTLRVRHLETLGRQVPEVSGVARVALDLGGHVPAGVGPGEALTTPGAFEAVAVIDVRRRGAGRVPERPLLHVGATSVSVHARPLGEEHLRLTLDRALPLRFGDRAVLRDPGSRALWGVQVLDADPPALRRRGSAGRRSIELDSLDGTMTRFLATRPVGRRTTLARLGLHDDIGPTGTLVAGDWLVGADHVDGLRHRLDSAVEESSDGLSVAAAARILELPDARLVLALVRPPLVHADGRVTRVADLPERAATALAKLRAELVAAPFAAPGADRLTELDIDDDTLAVLARRGLLLRLAPGVVLLPGADDSAVTRLAALTPPFTTSQARTALDTSRRVALPLLAHLDRTGRTVRLPDDRRRLVGS